MRLVILFLLPLMLIGCQSAPVQPAGQDEDMARIAGTAAAIAATRVAIAEASPTPAPTATVPATPTSERLALDESAAWRACQQLVLKHLKSPATARFPSVDDLRLSGWDLQRTLVFEGYVDSENSFGAMLRTAVLCEARDTGGTSWDVLAWLGDDATAALANNALRVPPGPVAPVARDGRNSLDSTPFDLQRGRYRARWTTDAPRCTMHVQGASGNPRIVVTDETGPTERGEAGITIPVRASYVVSTSSCGFWSLALRPE